MREPSSQAEIETDVAVIRKAMRELDGGRGEEAAAFFNRLRTRLLAMKAAAGARGSSENRGDESVRGEP
jgi:hypothetical protein